MASRTWRGRDDAGREAVLREVPTGVTPFFTAGLPETVVTLHEVVQIEGTRFGVWGMVNGLSLGEALERSVQNGQPLTLAVVGRILLDVSRSLISVRPQRPHGGLSDTSVLIDVDGKSHVMDFGVPRASRFNLNEPASFSGDVYAVAAILHSAMTGFSGSYAQAASDALSLPTPSQLRDDCTFALDEVIHRATSPVPERRPEDLSVFAEQLEWALGATLASREQVAALMRSFMRPIERDSPDDVPTGLYRRTQQETRNERSPSAGIATAPILPKKVSPTAFDVLNDAAEFTMQALNVPALLSGANDVDALGAQPAESTQLQPGVGAGANVPTPGSTKSSVTPGGTRTGVSRPSEEIDSDAFAPTARSMVPPNAVLHQRLQWAQSQQRVATPPFELPAREEPTRGAKPSTMRTGEAKRPPEVVDGEEYSQWSLDRLRASTGSRKVIAILLVLVAGIFAAVAWKTLFHSSSDVEAITAVAVDDEEDDAGIEDDDEDEMDGGVASSSTNDAGRKKKHVKKPNKKKRRR